MTMSVELQSRYLSKYALCRHSPIDPRSRRKAYMRYRRFIAGRGLDEQYGFGASLVFADRRA